MKKAILYFLFFYFVFNIEGKGEDAYEISKIICTSKSTQEDPFTMKFKKKEPHIEEEFYIEKKIDLKSGEIFYCIEAYGGKTKCLQSNYSYEVSYDFNPYVDPEDILYESFKKFREVFTYNTLFGKYYKKWSHWNSYYNYLWVYEERGVCEE